MQIKRYRNIIIAWVVFVLSEIFAALIVIHLVMFDYKPANEKKKVKWSPHVVIMAISLIIINGHGMVVFRLLPGFVTEKIKYFHAIIHTVAGLGAIYAYVVIHKFIDKREFSGLHFILAVITAVTYVVQWMVGLFMFLYMHTTQRRRKIFSAWHNFTGICILQFSIATSICMLQEVDFSNESGSLTSGSAIIEIVCYGVLINIIVLNPYLEWPLVGPL